MKRVTSFESKDGVLFSTEEACRAHENLIRKVAEILATLEPRPDNVEFFNGVGYVQQRPNNVLTVAVQLLQVLKTVFDSIPDEAPSIQVLGHIEYADAVCGDSGERGLPFKRALNRIKCTDQYGREWGRIYYCKNPAMATAVQLNPEFVT